MKSRVCGCRLELMFTKTAFTVECGSKCSSRKSTKNLPCRTSVSPRKANEDPGPRGGCGSWVLLYCQASDDRFLEAGHRSLQGGIGRCRYDPQGSRWHIDNDARGRASPGRARRDPEHGPGP